MGVDLERARPVDVDAISRLACSSTEQRVLRLSPGSGLRLWVRKEAALKARGCGLGSGIRTVLEDPTLSVADVNFGPTLLAACAVVAADGSAARVGQTG
nr:4'-phosphopantetheinyl transferase superfamily protein [Flexivirga aerilata]